MIWTDDPERDMERFFTQKPSNWDEWDELGEELAWERYQEHEKDRTSGNSDGPSIR